MVANATVVLSTLSVRVDLLCIVATSRAQSIIARRPTVAFGIRLGIISYYHSINGTTIYDARKEARGEFSETS